jgi:hypothetical protein
LVVPAREVDQDLRMAWAGLEHLYHILCVPKRAKEGESGEKNKCRRTAAPQL